MSPFEIFTITSTLGSSSFFLLRDRREEGVGGSKAKKSVFERVTCVNGDMSGVLVCVCV